MSILSVNFLIFTAVLTALYYLMPGKARPYLLLCGSTFFLVQFGLLNVLYILFSALCAYFAGLILHKKKLKAVLIAVLLVNFGLLLFTKFSPYAAEKFTGFTRIELPGFFTDVFVPIGISFYTLRLMAYCIDVYRGKFSAEKNPFFFLSYAFFFPLYIQGPIQSYDTLKGDLFDTSKKAHVYENITYGAQLILWGFFQKLVIAERAALYANEIFSDPGSFSAKHLVFGVFFYSVQILTDFSGCVDICRGAAQMLGISVMQNFKTPYFSESIPEFWRRWHISLSGWLKEYVYIPLGGNRKGKVRKYVNVIIVFLVSGIWHGVGVHYLVWGLLHGVYQVIGGITKPLRDKAYALCRIKRESAVPVWLRRIFTFLLVSFGWIFFRANGTGDALLIIKRIALRLPGAQVPSAIDRLDLAVFFIALAVLFFTSYYRNGGVSIRTRAAKLPLPVRFAIYLGLFLAVVIFGIYGPGYSAGGFIYMNF